MRNINLNQQSHYHFGNRLRNLMNIYTPTLKNEAALSKAMHERGILKYEETNREGKPKTKYECIRHKERRIHDHLGFSDCANVSVAWIKCYCDFFNCSADYLLGYIDLPTHQNTDVQKVTGLSDAAIKQLNILSNSNAIELRNNVSTLSYLIEYIPFSFDLLQKITVFLFKYWDCEKGKELSKDEKKRRPKTSNEHEEIKLMMSGYKPLMTSAELGKLKERKDVALFHAATNFSSVLTKIAEILYKDFKKGEKTTLINQSQGGCIYYNLPDTNE